MPRKPRQRSTPKHATTDSQAELAFLVECGIPIETACAAHGIDADDYATWIEAPAFARRMRQAEARAESKMINALLARAEEGDRQAITFLLERRFPQRWDKRVTSVLEEEYGDVVGRIEALSREIGRAAVDRVLEAVAGGDGEPAAGGETGERVH